MTRTLLLCVLVVSGAAIDVARASAEPMFISKQYPRCSTCHYSDTGGGLLTPYGRSLSRQELSTTGSNGAATEEGSSTGEEAFLWGRLGDALGPAQFGIDMRPSHVGIDVRGTTSNLDFFMTADLLGAYRAGGWTVYGEIGREARFPGWTIDSYEYWVSHVSERGFGVKAGRFFPAYGIRFADHTAFSRSFLGFDSYDQVLGVELSQSGERYLAQVSLAPGRADSVIDNDGRRAFTTTGRLQFEVGAHQVVAVSGQIRAASTFDPRRGMAGIAYGIAPVPRVSIWTEADLQQTAGSDGGRGYVFVNETAVEPFRGVWLKVSPQVRSETSRTSGVFRMAFEADLLPRTHWNVGVSYYRDKNRTFDLVTKTLLAQLHLYL